MSMSKHEQALLVTGTLDTSDVGGSPYRELKNVSVVFGAQVDLPSDPEVPMEEPKAVGADEPSENRPSEPVRVEEKQQARKRIPAKKPQASASAED